METKTRKVTEKRRAANRAAAQKSTGPKTDEGKQRAACNSFEHGAFASEPHILDQAVARAGGDAGEMDWLRHRTRLALVERQARHLSVAELQRDQRRFQAQHRPPAVEYNDYYPDGCALLPASQDKIDTMTQFLDELSLLITQGYWAEKTPKGHAYAPPTLLGFLYGQSPGTARGKRLRALWYSCAIEVGPGYVPTDAPLQAPAGRCAGGGDAGADRRGARGAGGRSRTRSPRSADRDRTARRPGLAGLASAR